MKKTQNSREQRCDDPLVVPLLMSSWVKLLTAPRADSRTLLLPLASCSLPTVGSLVRVKRSFRFSESTSVPFRCCSVIFDEAPGQKETRNDYGLPSHFTFRRSINHMVSNGLKFVTL